jgi:hypothetical protein
MQHAQRHAGEHPPVAPAKDFHETVAPVGEHQAVKTEIGRIRHDLDGIGKSTREREGGLQRGIERDLNEP